MPKNTRCCSALLLALLITFLSGCASNAAKTDPGVAESDLRDENFDVLFATEFPVTSKEEALVRAEEAMRAGDRQQMLFYYVKALRFDPDDTDLLIRIGQTHELQGTDEMAVRAYSLALASNPDLVPALESRGLLLLEHDEVDRSEQDLQKAVSIDNQAWRAFNGLGLIADRRKMHETAIAHYSSALEIRPGVPAILNNRGYSRLLANQLDGAESDLRQAAELGYDKAWINLGVLLAARSQYGDALRAFSAVLDRPQALNKVAEQAIENGDISKARSLLEEAIDTSPTYFPEAEENLMRIGLTN